ncbi:rai1 [Coprinopsis cinerea okayama7|uniref:Decapping nuclease n=1 Tax=Coprinopsis cinerea (strain Okayama-7 / 130 / ATCC MYA-4618 / FGSC 9003) TaxID=240176 RepID=A8P4E6_COPC7|nr:rai1 [Coprinopsis cinerea okayama7\|eukprot:XP_001838736.1 rai1 [Coprinopsis cinerea okayama7\
MSAHKRKLSDLSEGGNGAQGDNTDRPSQKARLESKNDASSSPQHPDPPKHLPYPPTGTNQRVKPTPFQLPTQITTFSYDGNHVQEFNDSALRYYVDPPPSARLDYGYDRWIKKPDDRGRLDPLLKALNRLKKDQAKAGLVPDNGVVCWRGIMTKILTAPYEDRDGWDLNVMFVNGVLYFEEHLTEKKLQEKNNMQPRQRLQTYYGYAFESYCTSETPTRHSARSNPGEPPGWGGDVNTNVQWCSVVRTKLGDSRIVIGGEVDCEIVVGFRTPSGVVTTTQSFKTIEIPRLVRGKPGAWDPLVCLDWGNTFLKFLKGIVSDSATAQAGKDAKSRVWRVTFVPGTGVNLRVLGESEVEEVVNGEDRIGFLPGWYWKELCATQASAASPMSRADHQTNTSPAVPNTISGWQV